MTATTMGPLGGGDGGGEDATTRRLVARHILQRLGEGGQPPEHDVSRINVGNETYLRVLDHEYFGQLLRIGASFKLVQGYFGGGKTHFLYCVRELAWNHGFATAVVELSPGECPYDDSFKVYRAVARRLSLKPSDPLVPPNLGIGDVVRSRVDDELDRAVAVLREQGTPEPEAAARQEVSRWLERTVGRAPCESHSFRQAVSQLGLAYLRDDSGTEQRLDAWLAGEPVPPKELRDVGVYEQLGRANGFTMLRCITQMVVALGLRGTALLFDEVDRNLSVSAKRSHAIGDNLRQVIDLCGRHQLPNTLFMYAVPPEFLRNVAPDYPALYQRLKSPVPLSVRSPQAVLIDLEKLDLDPVDMLDRLGLKILEVFEEARELKLDARLQRQNARELAVASVDAFFDVNHRRLFVKTWVDLLHRQMIDGELRLDDDAARKLVLDGYEGLTDTADDDGFADF
ncbi:MAG: BREX system ATP-binding domain-containing protein [Myxococcota bacterium]